MVMFLSFQNYSIHLGTDAKTAAMEQKFIFSIAEEAHATLYVAEHRYEFEIAKALMSGVLDTSGTLSQCNQRSPSRM